jgi:hypothetical protein
LGRFGSLSLSSQRSQGLVGLQELLTALLIIEIEFILVRLSITEGINTHTSSQPK